MGKAKKHENRTGTQLGIWTEDLDEENPDFYTRQLITYIGNKRALLGPIGVALGRVKRRLGRDKLRILDAFAGSGVVSRYFKASSSYLASNDLEEYSAVVAKCFLANRSQVDEVALRGIVDDFNCRVETTRMTLGFIQELYAPRDDDNISASDRVFYTSENARRLDDYRRLIGDAPAEFRNLLLGPLLGLASVHANTAGVFKGFYKDRVTGLGRFGGSGADALSRIRGCIKMATPSLSRFECNYEVFQEDANSLARKAKGLDLAYLDPPYNQHPYGSNYFMLNLLARYVKPTQVSTVSGIPTDWSRSGYNVRAKSLPLILDAVEAVDAPFVILAYNNEGFVDTNELFAALLNLGRVDVIATAYSAFRGSRNLHDRPTHVTEQLFLIEKS